MYRRSQFQKDLYRTGEVANILGVRPETVINCGKTGKLPIKRTSTNCRRFCNYDFRECGAITTE